MSNVNRNNCFATTGVADAYGKTRIAAAISTPSGRFRQPLRFDEQDVNVL